MSCRDFEEGLDALLSGRLDAGERQSLEAHASGCEQCLELLELARLPVEVPGDFAAAVLSRTSGSGCRQAEDSLPDWVDGRLQAGGERQLLSEHLTYCGVCSGLARELERLATDLPRLAIVQPGTSLVEGVLRRTLPVQVQMRRWWIATWPRWVRRPRFASELAFAATLMVVVVFGTPVSPLQAMPEQALDLARSESLERLEELQRVAEEDIPAGLQTVVASGTETAESLRVQARESVGTILEEVASWFVNADEQPPAESNQTTEETS